MIAESVAWVLAIVGLVIALGFGLLWRRTWKNLAKARLRVSTREEQFVVLAHEIKTPLTLVQMSADILLSDHSCDDRQRQLLVEVAEASDRLALLADNILTETRIELGVFSPTFAPTDVRDVLRGSWRSMHRLAERREQHIVIDYPQVMDSVMADRTLLQQAVTNLLQNAIRHTSRGGIVTLSAFQTAEDVVTSVWDDGDGMSPEARKDAFQRFVSHSGGTGMGLSIVSTIASLHGGKVRVDTNLGKGAAFLIALPRSRAAQ
jgi:signal transduction histidine kinase